MAPFNTIPCINMNLLCNNVMLTTHQYDLSYATILTFMYSYPLCHPRASLHTRLRFDLRFALSSCSLHHDMK
jgi:hypothetical protein